MKRIIPVILAGGIGERFWPMSRSTMPKQLLKIISDKTMVEETINRVKPLCSNEIKPLVITGKLIADTMRASLPATLDYDCIVEPVGKNTAPAIALAAQWINAKYGDCTMLILSADHDIRPNDQFLKAVSAASSIANSEKCLVLFGVQPSRPETGYGYIELGDYFSSNDCVKCFIVKRFVEKPDEKTAQKLIESGSYMWNSGMFVWNTSIILEEFSSLMPELFSMVQVIARENFSKAAIDTFYNECIKESIDFGIMEHSKRVFAVVGEFSWDDIGSWESLSRIHGKNEAGSTTCGSSVYEKECVDSIIFNGSKLSIATIGLKNVVLVATEDAILAINREKLPALKKYLNEMKKESSLSENLF